MTDKISIENREDWIKAASQLLEPLERLMVKGKSTIAIGDIPSNHDSRADDMESFARPFLLAAQWAVATDETERRARTLNWLAEGLLKGVKEDWGDPSNYHQSVVEAGVLILALEITEDLIWNRFSKSEKETIANWLGRIRALSFHFNNHMFFGVLPLCFLQKHGFERKGDRQLVENLLDKLEGMKIGGGWFRDGMNETVDYYNAYAFHYYSLMWGHFYGENDPKRRERWRFQTSKFIPDYVSFFADSGENPPFGRSMCYRFNACSPLALAALEGCSPIPAAQLRDICSRNVSFYMNQDIYNENRTLSIGLQREFLGIRELYNCSGSPYWAAKGFAALLLDKDHEFWTQPLEPAKEYKENSARVIAETGLATRRIDGEVEIINTDTAITTGNIYFGVYKWGKLGYRSGVGLQAPEKGETFSRDNSLSFVNDAGKIFGRHQTHRISLTENEAVFAYSFGDKATGLNIQIQTQLYWNGGWILQLHRVEGSGNGKIVLGSYSLPFSTTVPNCDMEPELTCLNNNNHYIAMQNMSGFEKVSQVINKDRHTHAINSSFIELAHDYSGEGIFLAALSYCGKTKPVAWRICEAEENKLVLRNTENTEWTIDSEFISEFIGGLELDVLTEKV